MSMGADPIGRWIPFLLLSSLAFLGPVVDHKVKADPSGFGDGRAADSPVANLKKGEGRPRARPVSATEAADFFEKEVRPLLVARCYKCHGELAKPKGKLRLTSRANILQGGKSGPAAVAGKPGDSLLVQAIGYTDALKMPPTERLPAREIDTLTRWVQMGLPWPASQPKAASGASNGPDTQTSSKLAGTEYQITDEQRNFWSFQPVKDTVPPEVRDSAWVVTAIDRFILKKLEEHGLRPAPMADKRTLIRRATFDLIGLPPAPEDIDAFLEDTSSDAFTKVVDRLLASPHYGERWGRHWLDLVRFAETHGHEFDPDIPDAWRYRDYVVRAFNADVPYNQFLTEHIAGDLLPEPRRNPKDNSNE